MHTGAVPPLVPGRSGRATMQVRFFRNRDLAALQQEINVWLGDRPDREIVEVAQSVRQPSEGGAGTDELIVSVWYVQA